MELPFLLARDGLCCQSALLKNNLSFFHYNVYHKIECTFGKRLQMPFIRYINMAAYKWCDIPKPIGYPLRGSSNKESLYNLTTSSPRLTNRVINLQAGNNNVLSFYMTYYAVGTSWHRFQFLIELRIRK